MLCQRNVKTLKNSMQLARRAAGAKPAPPPSARRPLPPAPATAVRPHSTPLIHALRRRQCSARAAGAAAADFGDAGSSSASSSAAAPVPATQEQQQQQYSFLRVVLPTALALMLCNMDRICLSVAMLPIAREMGWSAGIQGLVQSAFLWGYMATQLVGGTLADKYGGKLVMAAGVAWFSLASMLLPAAALTPWTAAAGLALPAVLVARFLVGFGEGVALPSMNNLVARLVDPARKATALGASFSGFHAGNLLGLLASPLILQRLGWRWLFYIYGVLGAPLLLLWLATVPDAPPRRAQQPQQQEQQQGQQPGPPSGAASGGGGGVTVATLLSKRATWAIIVANFVNHWGYFIYLSWMPTYFYQVLGLDLRASSFLSFIPWVVMAAGSSAAGLLADALVGAGVDVTRVRKGVQTVAFLGPVLALVLLSNHSISPAAAVACMAAALGITSLGQAGFVANISDVAPRHAGLLFGLCNTFGCLAGILGVSVCGFVLERTGSFAPIFQATAVLYVLGTAVWNAACTAEPQF